VNESGRERFSISPFEVRFTFFPSPSLKEIVNTTSLVKLYPQSFRLLRLCRPIALSLRPFTCSSISLKRQFTPLPFPTTRMDTSSLTSRLTTLNLSPSTSSTESTQATTKLLTYFFTPKSGSKHPQHEDKDLKLVVVTIEEGKNLGPAKQLASSVGLKDMRAVSGQDLDKLLKRTREQGTNSYSLLLTTTLLTSSTKSKCESKDWLTLFRISSFPSLPHSRTRFHHPPNHFNYPLFPLDRIPPLPLRSLRIPLPLARTISKDHLPTWIRRCRY